MAINHDVVWQNYAISMADRAHLLNQSPFVLWFTGLPGAGKTTLANVMAKRLHDLCRHAYVLDGDNLRHGLNKDLGFTVKDRRENVRRTAEVANLIYDSGLITLVACISPFTSERDFARSLLPEGRFVEVFVDTPQAICEKRDQKGLYRRARAGELSNFTGIDSPFERPNTSELVVNAGECSPLECADEITSYLVDRGLLVADWTPTGP
ncbi:MAG: adenylyl-sulfate kinase [Chloroflexi bacterium]|nr:adenylyl-sulfate kinase [Chloroflexota bacterium]